MVVTLWSIPLEVFIIEHLPIVCSDLLIRDIDDIRRVWVPRCEATVLIGLESYLRLLIVSWINRWLRLSRVIVRSLVMGRLWLCVHKIVIVEQMVSHACTLCVQHFLEAIIVVDSLAERMLVILPAAVVLR